MKARPMPMSAPMVRAILAGTKTQTRRAVHNPHRNDGGFVLQDYGNGWWPYRSHDGESGHYLDRQKDGDYYSEAPLRCPYGQPGDRLWVREAFRFPQSLDHLSPSEIGEKALAAGYPKPWCPTQFEADGLRRTPQEWRDFVTPPQANEAGRLRAGMHMPRWASRITLEVASVRVERLQDISEEDAQAEGARECDPVSGREVLLAGPSQRGSFVLHYRDIWEQINGPGSWEANPLVWVVEFKRLEVQQ